MPDDMPDDMEVLERRIERLRSEVRRAVAGGDRVRGQVMRAELREAERAWEDGLANLEEQSVPMAQEVPAAQDSAGSGGQAGVPPAGALVPVREQVHQTLVLLSVPAAPRLIVAVHEALFGGGLASARLTSLRRDEERSFRSAPYSRPYYLCAALTADLLAPARGLLAVSTWPMDRRVIGPLTPRVDFLTAAISVAEHLQRGPGPTPVARRLLWRFGGNIPGAAASLRRVRPETVASAARAELAVHQDDDLAYRAAAARRARAQLSDAEQLFGARLRVSRRAR